MLAVIVVGMHNFYKVLAYTDSNSVQEVRVKNCQQEPAKSHHSNHPTSSKYRANVGPWDPCTGTLTHYG
jgi:hypothetical protein